MTTARARALLVGLAVATSLGRLGAASADVVDAGEARITPSSGGSATAFSIELPKGAECPGDSADDGYRVNSYMVPAAVDPLDVTYGGEGPTPGSFGDAATFREPLFDIETNWFVSAQTADAEEPGEPGQIINIPQFSFGVYGPGDVPPGRYNVGIVCTLDNQITTIWDNQIEVTGAASDAPAQLEWRVLGGTGEASDSSSGSSAPAALGIAVVGAAGAVLILRRRQGRRTATSREGR